MLKGWDCSSVKLPMLARKVHSGEICSAVESRTVHRQCPAASVGEPHSLFSTGYGVPRNYSGCAAVREAVHAALVLFHLVKSCL